MRGLRRLGSDLQPSSDTLDDDRRGGVALTLEIPVLQDDLQKLKPSPRSLRSLGSDTGDLDELVIGPLPPGAQITGRDFDFEALSSGG